ncbi:MAG: hypothetical protein NT069_06830 [Planctomycetota bacterium]|nr:hypothetical protein [Planctomycetota bacterium]
MSASVQGNDVRKILAQFDAPAFVRRARAVEVADELLHSILTRQRDEWLLMPKTRLAQLVACLGHLKRLTDLGFPTSRIAQLEQLVAVWRPQTRTRVPIVAQTTDAIPTVRQLADSFLRFNRRWWPFVEQLDLAEINQIRDGYNRYYVIEKECSTGSAVLARRDFHVLPMWTAAKLLEAYPLLPDVSH